MNTSHSVIYRVTASAESQHNFCKCQLLMRFCGKCLCLPQVAQVWLTKADTRHVLLSPGFAHIWDIAPQIQACPYTFGHRTMLTRVLCIPSLARQFSRRHKSAITDELAINFNNTINDGKGQKWNEKKTEGQSPGAIWLYLAVASEY